MKPSRPNSKPTVASAPQSVPSPEPLPAWISRYPADPPQPRRTPLVISLVALAAWIGFLLYAALLAP